MLIDKILILVITFAVSTTSTLTGGHPVKPSAKPSTKPSVQAACAKITAKKAIQTAKASATTKTSAKPSTSARPTTSANQNTNNQHPVIQNEFIQAQRGDLPIIITAPHGGDLKIPGAPERVKGFKGKDTYTLEVAQQLSQQIHNSLGAKPYMVAARFSRKYIDANRSTSEAYEHPNAKPVYAAYHGTIQDFIKEIKTRFPNGAILIDIHGQGNDKNAIYRGTQNCKTVESLIERHGMKALTGKNSILGVLASCGYKVLPSNNESSKREHPSYNGGFTVGTYGSHREQGIDAIQLELGYRFRDPQNIPEFTRNLSRAICQFLTTYNYINYLRAR